MCVWVPGSTPCGCRAGWGIDNPTRLFIISISDGPLRGPIFIISISALPSPGLVIGVIIITSLGPWGPQAYILTMTCTIMI